MPVAIEVPGLDAFAAEIPDGGVVVLEGDLAPAKGTLARRIASTAAAARRPVTLLPTRGEAVEAVHVLEPDEWPADGHPSDHRPGSDFCFPLGTGAVPAPGPGAR